MNPEEKTVDVPESDEMKYKCVFYHDMECPVQKYLSERAIIQRYEQRIKPIAKSEVEEYTDVLTKSLKVLSEDYVAHLVSFCGICPFKYRRELDAHQRELGVRRIES